MLHLAELTFVIQRAGVESETHRMTTDFAPVEPLRETLARGQDYGTPRRAGPLKAMIDRTLDRMHQH